MGAVDEQFTFHAGLDRRRAVDCQLDADHHAADADVADQVALLPQFAKPLLEDRPQFLRGRQQVLLFNHRDGRNPGTGCDRIAAKRGRVHAGPQTGRSCSVASIAAPAIPPQIAFESVIMSGVTSTS